MSGHRDPVRCLEGAPGPAAVWGWEVCVGARGSPACRQQKLGGSLSPTVGRNLLLRSESDARVSGESEDLQGG